jgi:hypothetical protein
MSIDWTELGSKWQTLLLSPPFCVAWKHYIQYNIKTRLPFKKEKLQILYINGNAWELDNV